MLHKLLLLLLLLDRLSLLDGVWLLDIIIAVGADGILLLVLMELGLRLDLVELLLERVKHLLHLGWVSHVHLLETVCGYKLISRFLWFHK